MRERATAQAAGRADFAPPPNCQSPPFPLPPGGAVYYNDQDAQWADDGAGRSALASKQAARGKFFALLARQRRGGARAADGDEVIG